MRPHTSKVVYSKNDTIVDIFTEVITPKTYEQLAK